MKCACVDTNVILRFLTGEPAEMAAQATGLFAAVDRGELQLLVDEMVVAETVWVLHSYYHYSHADIARVLRELLAHPGIAADDLPGLLTALHLFADENIDFADALLAVHMQRRGVADIFSFDRHFDGLPGINRQAPGHVHQFVSS